MSIIMYKQRFAPPKDRFTPIKNYLHIGYIAMRPGSVKNEDGVHGLFGELSPDKPCAQMPWQETAKYVRQLSMGNVNIYRSIISFDRADADERGLITQKDWRDYAKHQIHILAEKNKIDFAGLGWCGAYHNEGEHPHLHIAFWDKTQRVLRNFTPPWVCNDIRVALIKSTFEDKINEFYERKKLAKENIAGSYNKALSDFDSYMKTMRMKHFKYVKSEFETYGDSRDVNIAQFFNSDEQLAAVAEKLFRLRNAIPKGGRIAYKLLPPEVKAEIDGLTDELIKDNTYLRSAVGQYVDSLCEIKKLYISLGDTDRLKEYRDKCEADARKQISKNIVKSIKAIISKEYEEKVAEYSTAQKQHFAVELMRGILDFFARGIVANNSEGYEKNNNTFGEFSDRAMREWYLKNKDKAMEFGG